MAATRVEAHCEPWLLKPSLKAVRSSGSHIQRRQLRQRSRLGKEQLPPGSCTVGRPHFQANTFSSALRGSRRSFTNCCQRSSASIAARSCSRQAQQAQRACSARSKGHNQPDQPAVQQALAPQADMSAAAHFRLCCTPPFPTGRSPTCQHTCQHTCCCPSLATCMRRLEICVTCPMYPARSGLRCSSPRVSPGRGSGTIWRSRGMARQILRCSPRLL